MLSVFKKDGKDFEVTGDSHIHSVISLTDGIKQWKSTSGRQDAIPGGCHSLSKMCMSHTYYIFKSVPGTMKAKAGRKKPRSLVINNN